MNCGGTYRQLPDNMKKMHTSVFGSRHIKSAIERVYMDVLVDARGHINMHYSNEDNDSNRDD